MSVEEKAREYCDDAGDGGTDPQTQRDIRIYLAGHAEAMRWRDPATQPTSGEWLVMFEDIKGICRCRVSHPTQRHKGREILGWREIGPLPEVKS